jgi:hypothetical protein
MDRGEPQRITVVTETRNLRTLPFVQNEDLLSTGKQWEEWIEGIEREFRYFRITEPVDKKDALLIYGRGREYRRSCRSRPPKFHKVRYFSVLSRSDCPTREKVRCGALGNSW